MGLYIRPNSILTAPHTPKPPDTKVDFLPSPMRVAVYCSARGRKTDCRMLEVFHRSAPRHALLRAFLQIAPRRRYVVAPKRNAARTGRTGDRGLEERHRGMHRYNRRACIGMHSVLRCTNVRATACALVQTCSSRPGLINVVSARLT